MLKSISSVLIYSISLSSCATSGDSTLLGLGIGTVVGGGIGATMGANDHNEARAGAVGAAVGAAIGGLAGYLTHKQDEERKRAMQIGNAGDAEGNPALTKPVVKRIWVDDKIEGDRLIRGHWIYVIDRQSTWTSPSRKE